MRIATLDGLRGYFILMMMMVHLKTIDPILQNFSHHKLGFVEDAQGFVFLSGIVVALAYGRIFQRSSFGEMRAKLHARVGSLVVYNMASLVLVFGLALGGFAFSDELRDFARIGGDAWQDVILAALFIDGPAYVDILPMYICFMLAAPIAIRALYAEGPVPVLAVSAAVWALSQSGIFLALGDWGTAALGLQREGGFDLTLNFIRWAWQLLFFSGLCLGVMFARGDLDLSRLQERKFEQLFHVALAAAAVFFLLRINGRLGIVNSPFLRVGLDRSNLGLLRLVNFIADAYIFTYVIVVGPLSERRWLAMIATALRAVLTLRPLVFLGQHSLQAYALHVALVYVVASVVFQFDLALGPVTSDAVLIACWAALFVPGLWITGRRRRERAVLAV